MQAFQDHFSGHAADYAASRPTYPDALFAWIAAQAPGTQLVWDCAAGNGQASVALARHFDQVIATEPSDAQLAHAAPAPNVTYRQGAAEDVPIHDEAGRVDAACVAQALHWFDAEAFGREVQRIVRPGGLLVVWSYALCTVTPGVDAVVQHLYDDVVGPYWPERRRLVESGYAGIPLPGEVIDPPAFAMEIDWSHEQYVAYLATWSACQRYAKDRGADPLDVVRDALAAAWGEVGTRTVSWPLTVRARRI